MLQELNDLRICVIGDPHFKASTAIQNLEMSKQIIDIVKNNNVDFVVVLGDTLDTHANIHMIPLVNSIDFLRQLQDLTKLYLLIGNHDLLNNKSYLKENYHPFSALKYWNNTEVIDTAKWITFNKNNISYHFTMLPYVEPGRFKEALELVPQYKDSICLFCHQEFVGAQMGCFTSVDGDIWVEDEPYVISGHIHDYQMLQSNIMYLGTPIQQSFGDKDNKFIALLTIKDKIINHENCCYEKIKLNMPVKKIIHLTYKEVSKYKLDKHIEAKIIITCTLTESKTLMKSPKIIDWKKNGVVVVYKDIPGELIKNEPYNHETFTSLLYKDIKNNNHLMSTYTEIFGNPI